MNELNNIVFNIRLKLRLKVLCFCFKDLWNTTSPDCFIPFLLYVFFVVRHGPSWRWTDSDLEISKFPRRIPYVGRFARRNLSVFFGYTPWHSQQRITFQNWALEDLPGNKDNLRKIHCQVIQRYSIRDLFYPLGGGHLTFFGGGHKNHHPKKVTSSRFARSLFLHFPLLQRCFRYYS